MNKQNEVLNKIMEMLPHEPKSYDISDDPGFWTDGTKILCPSEIEADVVAEFLRDVLAEYGNIDVYTGCYAPFKDAQSCEHNDCSGFWYIDFA